MSTKLKLVTGMVAAAGLFFIARAALVPERAASGVGGTHESLAGVVPIEVQPEAPGSSPEAGTGTGAQSGRQPVQPESAPSPVAEFDEQVAVAPTPLLGRVIDLGGFPVAGVPVVYTPFGRNSDDFEPVMSDGRGQFEFAEPHSSGQIDAVGERWATVLQPRRLDGVEDEPVLVVAPAVTFSGVVVDEGGAPVAQARLSLGIPDVARSKLDAVVDESHQREWEARSDERGWFEFPHAPSVAGTTLHASARGYVSSSQKVPLEGHTSLTLELARDAEQLTVLEGQILDAEGQPVPGAWATLGKASAPSDAEGFFRLEAQDEDGQRTLRAAAPGYLAAEFEGHPGRELRFAFPDPLVLILADRPVRLTGRVLDDRGRPAGGVHVWTPDETHFGEIPLDPDSDDPWITAQTIEAMARGDHPFFTEPVLTDSEGRFELEGLLPHAYVVCAWDERTHAYAQSEPTLPGALAEVRLPLAGLRPRVAGIVLGLGGTPVVGAKVELGSVLRIIPASGPDDAREEKRFGQGTVTNEEGRFEFADVPTSARWIYIAGGGLAKASKELLAEDLDLEALEFRLPLRCRLQVILPPGHAADKLQVLDQSGEPIDLVVKHGWVAWGSQSQSFQEGRSEVLRVSERAQTLVLYEGVEELSRLQLQLEPGELTVVRP